jgi:hypothetical protein
MTGDFHAIDGNDRDVVLISLEVRGIILNVAEDQVEWMPEPNRFNGLVDGLAEMAAGPGVEGDGLHPGK